MIAICRFGNYKSFSKLLTSQYQFGPLFNKDLSTYNKKLYDRILRVDHAGELGADRIYAGQHFVLQNTSVGPTIKHMWDQEKDHLATFEKLISKHKTRPSILLPLWNVAGFALGVGSAILGKQAAMACTVAVEDVISQHYNNQLRELIDSDTTDGENEELVQIIKRLRDEEMEHHDIGLNNEAEQAPFYQLFTKAIKTGCHAAIWAAERF